MMTDLAPQRTIHAVLVLLLIGGLVVPTSAASPQNVTVPSDTTIEVSTPIVYTSAVEYHLGNNATLLISAGSFQSDVAVFVGGCDTAAVRIAGDVNISGTLTFTGGATLTATKVQGSTRSRRV
jgi:hypothetical protein